MNELPTVLITPGDPAGIGPEIVLKALCETDVSTICRPIVVGDAFVLSRISQHLQLKCQFHPIPSPTSSTYLAGRINIIDVRTTGIQGLARGRPQTLAAESAITAVRRAANLALDDRAKAVVTGPVNKKALKLKGCPWVGHTEMLQDLTKSPRAMTMFVTGALRIFFATHHVSLQQAIELLKKPLLYATIVDVKVEMQRLGFSQPRLAVAGLNPHAGDAGLFGREEIDQIEPAVRQAQKAGILVKGPIPADAVFHQCIMGAYDAVIALTHDQGRIAAKTLDFWRPVSVTLGLPFIRTSVDHGTAYDIAWQGKANPTSLKEALTVAVELVKRQGSTLGAQHSVP